MSSVIPLKFVGEKCYQKCVIPLHLFEKTNLKLFEYVSLKTHDYVYICVVDITTKPLTCVFIDDTVSCANFFTPTSIKRKESLVFPDNISPVEFSYFDRIVVKILLKNNDVPNYDKTICENVVHNLLSGYVTKKNCIVSCRGLKLADAFHIHGILISETVPADICGRSRKTTNVEIIDVISYEQLCQLNSFQSIELGGIDHSMELLTFYTIQSYKSCGVLVSGPSGCGKSSLVKKFCYDINCFFIWIDGLKTTDFTVSNCNVYCDQFSSCLKMFPKRYCLLFIDHIDFIVPCNTKQKLSTVSALVSLINIVKQLGVFVIATSAHKRNMNFKVASLFDKELNLGIPSLQQRKEIIEVLCKSYNSQVDYYKVADMTPGFVAHDISLLLKEAINISQKQQRSIEETDLGCLTTKDVENALASVSPSILKTSRWNMKVKPVHWSDIGGMFHVKKKLQMCIEWPLQNPEIFKKVDLPCPRGVLLYGPPGCCKTTLASCLATECNANFFVANPAQIYSLYVGESEKNITELFYQARLCAPSIIFLDELDSLVSKRKWDTKSQGIGEKVLSTLLNEMDGFGTRVQLLNNMNAQKLLNDEENTNSTINRQEKEQLSEQDVIVVAATNRPDLIDDALLRPGRFDVILYVPPPNLEERESILQTVIKDMPVKDVDFKKIAKSTNIFSGADLKSLCKEAVMNALRHDIETTSITGENFDNALKKILPSITRQQIQMYEKLSSKYGTVIKNI